MDRITITGEMLETIREEIPQNALGKIDITLVELGGYDPVGVVFDVGYGRKYVTVTHNGIAYPAGGLAAPEWAKGDES